MNPTPLLTGLNNTATGQGGDHYRGEGGVATGGEYHNALEPFLGPPTKAIDHEPSFRFPHEAWFLPDAYQGRNDYIRETIVQTVVNYNSFMTTEILPWKQQDNPNIAWDSIKFDKTLIDLEPEQGVPRYVTVERESHTDYMVRRGLALIVNHGFASTPGGQKDFMYKVATIAGAVQETCDQSGLVALLRSKNEYRGHLMETIRTAADAYDMFHNELWRFGIIQHSERGWYHIDAEAEHVMQMENIQPDTWIVPSRMTSYAAYGQLAETEVYRAGEKVARGNLELGKDRFTSFRGKNVYETRPFQLDVDGRIVDPLNRNRMIGDFFVVPFYELRCFQNGGNSLWPVAEEGQTQAYCCESDRFETFSWKDMHRLSEFGDVSATLFEQHQSNTNYSFDDIENENGQDKYIGFMRAIAVHEALRRSTDAQGGSAAIRNLLETHDNADWNGFLPSFLQGYNLANRGDEMGEREHNRIAACNLQYGPPHRGHTMRSNAAVGQAQMPVRAATDLNEATSTAIRGAVRHAVHQRHNIDPDSAAQCAATWGKALSQNGYSDEDALRHMTAALHTVAEKTIAQTANESPEELNRKLHHDPETGARLSSDAVERDIHNGFIRSDEADGPFDLMLSEAEDLALECAAAEKSGAPVAHAGAKYIFPPERAEPDKGWDHVGPTTAVYDLHQFATFVIAACQQGKCGILQESIFSRVRLVKKSSANGEIVEIALYGTPPNEATAMLDLLGNTGVPVNVGAMKKAAKALQQWTTIHENAEHRFALTAPRNFDKWFPQGLLEDKVVGAADDRHAKAEMGGYDILCLRPFRQYTMGTGIMLKKGSELGNTFRGWADFQLTDNIIAKTHIGHFTFWHASIVTNPKCLFLAEDIFCTNYISGEGSKPLSWKYINDFHNDPLGTMNKHGASIICLPVPVGAMDPVDKRLQMNNPISLTGVLDPIMRSAVGNNQAACVNIGDYELNGKSRRVINSLQQMWDAAAPGLQQRFDPTRPNPLVANPRPYVAEANNRSDLSGQTYSDMYSALFGFHNMNHDVDYENSRTYETACRVTNTMCFHTMQKHRNPLNNRWEVTNLNTGHFGENGIYEGVKKIRSGYLDYFKDMEYQKAMGMGGLSI